MSKCVSVKKRETPVKKTGELDGRSVLDHVASHATLAGTATAPSEPPKKDGASNPRKQRYQTVLEVERETALPGGTTGIRHMEAVLEFDANGNGIIQGLFPGQQKPARASKSGSVQEPTTPPPTNQGPVIYSTSARPGSRDGGRTSASGIIPGTSAYDPSGGEGGDQQGMQNLLMSPIGRNSMTLGRSSSIVKGRTMGRSGSTLRTSVTGAIGPDGTLQPGTGRFRDLPDPACMQFDPSMIPMPPPGAPPSPGLGRTVGRSSSIMRGDGASRDRGVSESGDDGGMFQPSLSVRIRSQMEPDPKNRVAKTTATRGGVRASTDFSFDQGSSIFDRLTDPAHCAMGVTARRSITGAVISSPAAALGGAGLASTAPGPTPSPSAVPILATTARV